MRIIQKTLLLFISLCFFNISSADDLPVRIEVKEFDGNTIFVFYHLQNQNLSINAHGKLVKVDYQIPLNFNYVNKGKFLNLATNPKLSKDKKSITFTTKQEYKFKTIINGEKLTAIKFRDQVEEIKEKPLEKVEAKIQDNPTPIQIKDKKADDYIKTEDQVHPVKYFLKKGEPVISFDFDKIKDAKMGAFFRGKYLWIVFDQPRKFNLAKNNIILDFSQIRSQKDSIFRIKINDYANAKVNKIGAKWNITLLKNKIIDKKLRFNIEKLDNNEGLKIKGDFQNAELINFNDPEIGDTIEILAFKDPNIKIQETREHIDFNLTPSIQGIAITVNGEGVTVTKELGEVNIISKHQLPINSKTQEPPSSLTPLLPNENNLETLLPIIDKKLDILDFNQNKARLVLEIALSENPDDIFKKRLELAKFLFMHGWYLESYSALNLCKITNPKLFNSNLQAQFLIAVSATITGNFNEAKYIYHELLKSVDDNVSSEIKLWDNYNEFQLGNSPKTIGFLNNLNKFINFYPDNLYWLLTLTEIELSLLGNDLKTTELILKDLRTPFNKEANSLNYYKANYYRKKDQLNLAKQFFQDIVKKDHDPFNKVRAEMDLVKLQYELKEIKLPEAIKRLAALRFTWRGDKIEYDLLMQLAGYYRDNKNSMDALRTFKYIQTAFSNKISNFYITSEMVKIFNTIFLSGGTVEEMDDFTAVALFYEFKDLNPIGIEGDEVILSIARRLTKLDLLENAAELLRHQIKYRLIGDRRVNNADYLAIILLMDKKPNEAIQALEETDKDNFKFAEHQYRIRLRAKALIDLNKFSEALTFLKEDDSPDADILKKEAFFRAERWQDFIDFVEKPIKSLVDLKIEDATLQDALRLAISYYKLNKIAELTSYYNSISKENQNLKDIINLLLTTGTPIDYKNLDKSLNVNQMQMLLEKYKNQVEIK